MSQSPSITLVQSRALIAAVSIALFGGTTIAGVGFVRLAATAFDTVRTSPEIHFVLVLYAAVILFLCYLDFLCVATAVHPRKLIISVDGITEIGRNQTRSECWKDISNPTKRIAKSNASGVVYLEFERLSGDPFSVRADIYSESYEDILNLVQSAIAGEPLIKVQRRVRIAYYLLAGFSAALIVTAVHFVVA